MAVVALIAVGLLTRTAVLASDIEQKTGSIAETGRGINIATDSIIQLNDTVGFGESILATATPLQGQLETVIGIAATIDQHIASITGSVTSIGASATAIGASGDSINQSARGINSELGAIIPIADSIRNGIVTINRNIDRTLELAVLITADTGNIVDVAANIQTNAACINQALGPDPACR